MINKFFILCVVGFGLWFILTEADAADTTVKGTTTTSAAASLEVTNSANTSLLYVRNDGNVGIGTASPSVKLDVNGITRVGTNTKYIQLSGNDGGSQEIPAGVSIRASNHNLTISGGSNDGNTVGLYYYEGIGGMRSALEVASKTSGFSNLVLMKSGGNVGIGTTSPKSALHVVGLPVYANNAAAVAGGLTVGAFYRTGGDPDLVCVVH